MAAKALAFDVGDYVVYPKHGVGRVVELQSEEIAGMQLELYVLRFEKERMTLRVPVNKVESIGMRKLSSDYSERQIFEAASSRLARELAAMEKTDEPAALEKILSVLREHAPQYYENTEEA